MAMQSSKFNVYYEDTDAAGVVYYANYLKFAERGRTDALTALGIDQHALMQEQGLCFVVSRVEVDYKRPAKLGDEITVQTHISKLGRSRVCMEQQLMRDSALLSLLKVTVAMIDKAGKPQRIPDELGNALKQLELTD